MLLRLVGYAHAQARRIAEAKAAFGASLALARAAEASYEQALAHRALADVGEDADANAERAQRLLDALGVVALPAVPLD